MKKIVLFLAVALMSIVMCSCSENYSEGEKVGVLTEFAKSGLLWDSWDGNLNITQTGMNTSGDPFTFSFDNDRDDQSQLIDLMKEAQVKGWKIKIKYHRVRGWNWFKNRGRSQYFVNDVEVLDSAFATPLMRNMPNAVDASPAGHVIDTIYLVIDKSQFNH